eukprot:320366-Pleurochrysis_carterae.AAC.1
MAAGSAGCPPGAPRAWACVALAPPQACDTIYLKRAVVPSPRTGSASGGRCGGPRDCRAAAPRRQSVASV